MNPIVCVYDPQYCTLNKELMDLILTEKWGRQNDNQLAWLKEGLTTYATPEIDNCDNFGFEERYAYLMQHNSLIDLMKFAQSELFVENKIVRTQSAYLVKYLLDRYGIEKLKQLWVSGMSDFEKIYGVSFEELKVAINKELEKEYSSPIEINWEEFAKDCISPQSDGWLDAYEPNALIPRFEGMITKESGQFKFTINSTIDEVKRDEIIIKTKEYITQNLDLINDDGFNDSIHIILARDREQMKKLLDISMGGVFIPKSNDNVEAVFSPKENKVYAVHSDSYSTLKHELMHAVTMLKWGQLSSKESRLEWLIEGIATFADPKTDNCDGHSFEERYAFFLQKGKLLGVEELMTFPSILEDSRRIDIKIAYNQSAYIVEYLLEKYGIEKIHELWINGMESFEKIFGISFDQIIFNIDEELNRKYPNLIDFNWETFEKGCAE